MLLSIMKRAMRLVVTLQIMKVTSIDGLKTTKTIAWKLVAGAGFEPTTFGL